jgi:hypothetical protein
VSAMQQSMSSSDPKVQKAVKACKVSMP